MSINILNTLKMMRVHQYLKNIFIFAPLFFAGKIFELDLLTSSLWIFLFFSLVASSIYIINDIIDIEYDKVHKKKKNRPIASGKISLNTAKTACIVLMTAGLVGLALISINVFLIATGYIVLNLMYTMFLKHIAIVDITIIAIGFVLRLFLGSEGSNIYLSEWIIVTTFFLALFLATAKRRSEILSIEENKSVTRKSIDGYSIEITNMILNTTMTISIVSYLLYTILGQSIIQNLYLTTFFVVLGIFRFLQIVTTTTHAEEPTKVILKDKLIQIIAISWVLSFGILLYG